MNLTSLLPDQHLFIGGTTGSGKSYLAKELFRVADGGALYFNYPEKEKDDYDIPGYKADPSTPPQAIKKGFERGEMLKYNPPWKTEKALKDFRNIYEIAKLVTGDTYLFIDEAHLFAKDETSVIYAIRDGRGHSVHVIPISQRPKDINTDGLSQINDQILFELSDQQRAYFNQFNMPFEDITAWTSQQYHFVRYNGNELEKFKPIPFNE